MFSDTQKALNAFIESYQLAYENAEVSLRAFCQDPSESPCCYGEVSEQSSLWRPVLQQSVLDFSKLETGLEIKIDAAFQDYFCTWWGDHLNARTERGELQLLLVWNDDDFQRLQENLIAHVLMKRRLGQRDTLFFAQTEDDDFLLSVLNQTGEVVLEPVGKEPQEILAPSLTDFLQTLTPVVSRYS